MDDPPSIDVQTDGDTPGGASQSPPEDCDLALCVLSSSSSGNCSALVVGRGEARRVILIDLGLSPRRTWRLLERVGLGGTPIAGVLITHFDDDHYYAGWSAALPEGCVQHVHRRHRGRAERVGALAATTSVFEDAFEIAPGTTVRPIVQAHDYLGSVSYRIDHACENRIASIGYATDLGRANAAWVEHMGGVHVLAIESNYCPRLQGLSGRPEFLQRRIMGGSGHLSNEQCAEAVARVAPAEHVVLLHLSRQCNAAELAASYHARRGYGLTVARPRDPSPWVGTRGVQRQEGTQREVAVRQRAVQQLLFG